MEIFNTTPYVVFHFDSSPDPAKPTVTLVVKGTFKLRPGEAALAVPEKKQLPPMGDDPHMDDLGRSLRYATDLAPAKARGEATINAVCHVADGRARPTCDVSIEIGPIRKKLRVTGDRAWVKEPAVVITRPLPFEHLPIRWERAFGGLGVPTNPLGRGAEPEPDDAGQLIHWLPNVEYPGRLVGKLDDAPPPAGFGPVSPMWQPRLKRHGTRDQRWAAFRAPLPPKDFDPLAHNAAPDDQILSEGYFRGDEAIVMTGLHPLWPVYRTALPGKRLRLFLVIAKPPEREGAPPAPEPEGVPPRFVEMQMSLDTVHVEMESEALVMLWRRQVPSLADPAHPEFEALYVFEEELGERPLPREECFARFLALRDPPKPPAPEPEPKPEEEAEPTTMTAEEAAVIDEQMGAAKKILEDAKLDPKVLEKLDATKDPADALKILMAHADEQLGALAQVTATLKAMK